MLSHLTFTLRYKCDNHYRFRVHSHAFIIHDTYRCTVRVVKSLRAGVGKTLYKRRISEKLEELSKNVNRIGAAVVTIPLHERKINVDEVMASLLENTLPPNIEEPRLIHLDLAQEVTH